MTYFCSQFSGLIFSQLILINCYSDAQCSYSSYDTIRINRMTKLKVMPVTATQKIWMDIRYIQKRNENSISFMCLHFLQYFSYGDSKYQIIEENGKSSKVNWNTRKKREKKQKTPKNTPNWIEKYRMACCAEFVVVFLAFWQFLSIFGDFWFSSCFVRWFLVTLVVPVIPLVPIQIDVCIECIIFYLFIHH